MEAAAAAGQSSGRALRSALARYATGVAVVTARTEAGERLGMTVSSFNSVSLEPPLVLFCVANSARSLPAWLTVSSFGISILGERQSELSTRFARSQGEKWHGLEPLRGEAVDVPLLPDALGWFECGVQARHEGGDHIIVVGRVLSFRRGAGADPRPLVFFDGSYRRLDPGAALAMPADIDPWYHFW